LKASACQSSAATAYSATENSGNKSLDVPDHPLHTLLQTLARLG